jgi:phenylalanine-4-hydroxylase
MNNEKPIELGFTLEQIITESYRSNTLIKEIYDIKFFSDLYLATCGSSIVFIYEVNKLNQHL